MNHDRPVQRRHRDRRGSLLRAKQVVPPTQHLSPPTPHSRQELGVTICGQLEGRLGVGPTWLVVGPYGPPRRLIVHQHLAPLDRADRVKGAGVLVARGIDRGLRDVVFGLPDLGPAVELLEVRQHRNPDVRPLTLFDVPFHGVVDSRAQGRRANLAGWRAFPGVSQVAYNGLGALLLHPSLQRPGHPDGSERGLLGRPEEECRFVQRSDDGRHRIKSSVSVHDPPPNSGWPPLRGHPPPDHDTTTPVSAVWCEFRAE